VVQLSQTPTLDQNGGTVEKHTKKDSYKRIKRWDLTTISTLLVQLSHQAYTEGPKPLGTCNLPEMQLIPKSLQGNLEARS
jgi:hypothetical protein